MLNLWAPSYLCGGVHSTHLWKRPRCIHHAVSSSPWFLGSPAVRRGHTSDLWMITGLGSDQIPLSGLPKTFSWPSTSSLTYTLKLQDREGTSWKGWRSQCLRLKGEPQDMLPVRTHAPDLNESKKQTPTTVLGQLIATTSLSWWTQHLRGGWNTYSKIKSTW